MDYHAEQLVVKQKTATEYLLATLTIASAVILWFLIFTLLQAHPTIATFLIFGIGWGAWKIIQALNVEYEYEITNQYLDIDKIMGMARRKHLFSVDLKKINACDYVNSEKYENKSNISKVYDFSGNPAADGRVFIDFIPEKKTEMIRIIIKPNEKVVGVINHADPRNIKL